MVNIVEINSCNFGSTGRIMIGIADVAEDAGIETTFCCPYSRSNAVYRDERQFYIGNRVYNNLHLLFGYMTGLAGMFSIIPTLKLLKKIDKFEPDVIQLHNLHNSYINIPMLFSYIKKRKIRVVWTLHDCWALTGHCPYYTVSGCERWQDSCYDCPQFKKYPASLVDNAAFMHKQKKKWFIGVEDLTIIVPSKWLKEQVEKSFLKGYECKVIYNGIDTECFKKKKSEFKAMYGIENKMILGVAATWTTAKGLDVFVELAKSQKDYTVVLVGTNDEVDKVLPDGVVSIHQTRDVEMLAEIYSAADVFLNPTREEVLGLVNIEALACGTPVITFNSGGSPECIDESCGVVVEPDIHIDELAKVIDRVCSDGSYSEEACRKRALEFQNDIKYREYINVYLNKS